MEYVFWIVVIIGVVGGVLVAIGKNIQTDEAKEKYEKSLEHIGTGMI